MGCTSCSTNSGNAPGCQSKGSCSTGNCGKMPVFNWLSNMSLPAGQAPFDIFEIRFKNGRKEFFKNKKSLSIQIGDTVAVESSPGHDIGVVSLKGELVRLQMRKKNVELTSEKVKTIYRHASINDLEKWRFARSREQKTMHKSREIASKLGLDMKIGDVEFQADNIKAIFYYTSEGRVDFRELIKQMASEFNVRIEMCQIGVRQEAQRMGGIGSCGRELCCSTWLNDFRSVSTSAARYQQLSLNPQKLAGQCGKLKCCLNYELDMYVEAIKDFPDTNLKLKTKKGMAFLQKTDIFRRKVWYSYTNEPSIFIELNLDDVLEIIRQNNDKKSPESLEMYVATVYEVAQPDYENVVGQDSITRFDKGKSSKNRKKSRSNFHKSNQGKLNSNNPSSKAEEKSDKSIDRKGLNHRKVIAKVKSEYKNKSTPSKSN